MTLILTLFFLPHQFSVVQEPLTIQAVVAAYTASIEETDSDPGHNAANKTPQIGDIANNCLPLGSQVKIDGYLYTVNDRLNHRYDECKYFDILMSSRVEALKFGRQIKQIIIL